MFISKFKMINHIDDYLTFNCRYFTIARNYKLSDISWTANIEHAELFCGNRVMYCIISQH